jgi:hypothetical protein
MEYSYFQELDQVRVDYTRGNETATIGRVVFSMMFFMRDSENPELWDRLVQADEYTRKIIPESAYRWWIGSEDGRPKKTQNRPPITGQMELDECRKRNDTVFAMTLWDSEKPLADAPGHLLKYRTDVSYDRFEEASSFQLSFPLPWLELQNDPGLVQRVFRDLTDILYPFHAVAGLSLATSLDYIWTQTGRETFYPLLKRFPGLMNMQARRYQWHSFHHMGTVNWLTAVHEELLDRCGGRDAVLAQLDIDGFETWDYPGGLIIQAGSVPQIGDNDLGIKIPHYGKVARALKPVRVQYVSRPVAPEYQIPGTMSEEQIYQDPDLEKAAQNEYLTRLDDM